MDGSLRSCHQDGWAAQAHESPGGDFCGRQPGFGSVPCPGAETTPAPTPGGSRPLLAKLCGPWRRGQRHDLRSRGKTRKGGPGWVSSALGPRAPGWRGGRLCPRRTVPGQVYHAGQVGQVSGSRHRRHPGRTRGRPGTGSESSVKKVKRQEGRLRWHRGLRTETRAAKRRGNRIRAPGAGLSPLPALRGLRPSLAGESPPLR